jgi:hypothetical protein
MPNGQLPRSRSLGNMGASGQRASERRVLRTVRGVFDGENKRRLSKQVKLVRKLRIDRTIDSVVS